MVLYYFCRKSLYLGVPTGFYEAHKVTCLVPRRLSFDENVRAKEGGKEFITSHSFRARLCQAKNEAPEEEAVR